MRSGFGQGFKFGNGHGLEFRIGLRVGIRVWDWYRLHDGAVGFIAAPAHDGAVDLGRSLTHSLSRSLTRSLRHALPRWGVRFAFQASGFRVDVPGFRV